MDQYSSTYEPKATINPAELLETEGAHTFLELLEPSGTANAVYSDSTAYLDDITLDPIQEQPYRHPSSTERTWPDLPDSITAIRQEDLYNLLKTIDRTFLLAHDYLNYGGQFETITQNIYNRTRQEADSLSPTDLSGQIIEEQQAIPDQYDNKTWPFLTAVGGTLTYKYTQSKLAATAAIGSALMIVYDAIASTQNSRKRIKHKTKTAAYADSFEEQVAPQLADELNTIIVTDTKPQDDSKPLLPYWKHINIPPVV